jgi:tRNA A37 threonylcarbamoyladenosine dehydratase
MAEWTERSFYLKKEGLDKLHNANVLIGLGGVGSLQLSFG